MIPDDKEAISTPTPQPKLPVLDGTAQAQSKQRTLHFWQLLITSVRAQVVRRWTPLTAGCSCRCGYFLTGTEGCLILQVLTEGREGERKWAMEMKKRHVAGSTADKGRHVQSLFIPFSLLGCFKKNVYFFFKYLPKWEPHKHFFDSDFVITETLLDHICLNDGQTRVFFSLFCFFCQSERRGLSFGERQNERITLRGEAGTNEWAKKDKMEWSSIKRLAVISSSPPSPLALMS